MKNSFSSIIIITSPHPLACVSSPFLCITSLSFDACSYTEIVPKMDEKERATRRNARNAAGFSSSLYCNDDTRKCHFLWMYVCVKGVVCKGVLNILCSFSKELVEKVISHKGFNIMFFE